MIYPEDAFKGYDALFACGPHHEREFAALSKKLGVDPKECFPIGYGKLDILAASMVRAKEPVSVNKRKCVLIAPSWGGGNLIDSFGTDLCELLLDDGLEVVVRPHPMFFMEERAELKDFVQLQKNHPFFKLENPMSSDGEAILRADVLVGDYSGVSLEFAALRRMPVVSVNVPPKVVNRHWEEIGIEPIELKIRESIGVLVDSDLTAVSEAVSSIVSAPKIERTSQADISSFLYGGTGSCSLEAFNALSSLLGGEL
ncbi:hypothetical protein TH8_08510 [Thalassospira profundimaris]|nr:hypothetical protein TH8_08510 [Thalassospira profundimaris]